MLSITTSDVRLFLHVLGATVWVGGQIIFSALVPVLRRLGTDVLRPVARQLTQILWIGFALLIVTGVWNLFAVDLGSQSQAYKMTLYVKLASSRYRASRPGSTCSSPPPGPARCGGRRPASRRLRRCCWASSWPASAIGMRSREIDLPHPSLPGGRMPALSRWCVRFALVYLVVGMGLGSWMLIEQAREVPVGSALPVLHVHILLVGFLLLLVIGIAHWMFPRVQGARPGRTGGWIAFGLVNLGLVMRVIAEPEVDAGGGGAWRWVLGASAVLPTLGIAVFAVTLAPRIRAAMTPEAARALRERANKN